MELAAELAAAAALGVRITRVAYRTDKSLLAAGVLAGEPVAVKCLLGTDAFWAARFRREVDVYRAFAVSPPPVTVPRLIHSEGARLLVTGWLDGRRLDDSRYPPQVLDPGEVSAVLRAVTTLNRWRPPAGAFAPALDYPGRFRRYHRSGYLGDADHAALVGLVGRAGQPGELNHGDPLPGNFLLSRRGSAGPHRSGGPSAALVDWEQAGLYLPGFDLAILWTLAGACTPAVRASIDDIVDARGIGAAFAVNLAAVVSRELRMHDELEPGPVRDFRLPLIQAAWQLARQRLHNAARRA